MRHDFLNAQGIERVGLHLAEATLRPTAKKLRHYAAEWLAGIAIVALIYGFLVAFRGGTEVFADFSAFGKCERHNAQLVFMPTEFGKSVFRCPKCDAESQARIRSLMNTTDGDARARLRGPR